MVEVRPVYNQMNGREVYNTRNIVLTQDNGYEINILVGIGYRQPIGQPIQFSSSRTHLYQAHIAVIMDFLGNMKIVKNRYGRDGGNLTNLEVRQELWSAFEVMGLSYYDCALMLGNFNQAVSEILDEPVITSPQHPLGINYRDYMLGNYENCGGLINYRIKRHKLI